MIWVNSSFNLEKEIIKKWSPYVDKHLNINNLHFSYLCCHYLDFLQKENQDIGKKIIELKDRISVMDNFRYEIKNEFFNLLTGRVEYLLSDNTIVDPENFVQFLLGLKKNLLQIFRILSNR